MKTLLALLILIPSLSLGDTIFDKMPNTKSSIKKFYNYEIGYQFKYEWDDFYLYGNFDSFVEKYPYVWLQQDSINQRAFRIQKSKENVLLSFDKDKIITAIRYNDDFDEILNKKLRKDLSIYESKEFYEKYTPYGKCYEELQKIKKAIKFKLDINDRFLETYQYFPNAKEDEPILTFHSVIKSVPDKTILNLSCYYMFNDRLSSEFDAILFNSEMFNFGIQVDTEKNSEIFSNDTLVSKEEFKEIFDILTSDVYGLLKEL